VAQLGFMVDRPYVVTPHGAYSPAALRRSRVRKRLALATMERAALRRAAAIVALTDAESEQLRRWSGATPVVVIPNGVTPPPQVDPHALRRELGLPPEVRLAVFAGRLDRKHKGLDQLITGLALAPDWVLAMVGPDDRGDRALLEEQASSLGVADRCAFLGLREGSALHEALAGGDVYALCSRWEGLPLSLLEALAHGTPALVSPAVERAVPVAARGAGWACDPSNVGQTLQEIESAGEEERLRRGTAAAALSRDYRWHTVGSRLVRLYENVAAKKS
jgi:glycosyltransferase involved in cell wall biosynthesis